MPQKTEYVVLDLIDNAFRNAKVQPLNLGGLSGGGGGVGGPPGGIIGQLIQSRVTYDETEAATLFTPFSGMSLVDNLNHIRYRIGVLESGGGTALTVQDWDGIPSISNVDTITFSGVVITDLGGGNVLVAITASGGGIEEAPIDGTTYGRKDGTWVVFSGGSELVTHVYNEDLTIQIPTTTFSTQYTYASGTLRVYYNGVRQRKGIHYLDDADFIIFSTYFTTYSGDSMIVDYDYYTSQQTGGEFSLMDSDGILIVDSDGIELTETL